MRLVTPLIFLFFSVLSLFGQKTHLNAILAPADEPVTYLLFTEDGADIIVQEAFKARSADLARDHPYLTVSGDFTGDGVDELAVFNDLEYTPNMNPAFTCSVVSVYRSTGEQFLPAGSWFSCPDSQLDFEFVSFSVAGDFTGDGLCDIALFYNDPSLDQSTIYLLESTGSGFAEARAWYRVARNEFNFTALKFACPGDFNGNGKPGILVFYNYFGTEPGTRQSLFLFEAEADTLALLPRAYDATKASYDFSRMKFALAGDYNLDGFSDIAVLHEDPADLDLFITVFEGSADGLLTPVDYVSYADIEPWLMQVLHAAGGEFAGDSATDLALFYDNPGTGSQEIIVLESDHGTFKAPETVFSADPGTLDLEAITTVRSGAFVHHPLVRATTWKDDMTGALSFTFDDGYRGAFEYGGAELEAAGLKGIFYIFTDTSAVYNGELASTSLVREYRDKGHEIASHTSNHANLGFLTESGDVDSLNQVLSASVALLNERFDQHTLTMSIPFGSFRYETLDYISQYFYSARSSQFGFNLATPYDFYALRSWPVLSTTSPAYVESLLSTAEGYGTYLPLMYHDMLDEPFDEASLIYTYSRELFFQTIQDALSRNLWIETHERIYKYIRERNALKISRLETGNMEGPSGHFSFEADDGLIDSIFDVELTLKISLPGSWMEDTVSVGSEGEYSYFRIREDEQGSFFLYDWLPVSGTSLEVFEGRLPGTAVAERIARPLEISLRAAPNPFLHETRITLSGEAGRDTCLIIRDIQGRSIREIREFNGTSIQISRESLSPGMYLIQLVDPGKKGAFLKIIAE
ncbi:MAG: polysaccharide deacetylase family protein [Bacteroidales bacterium]|nr:polysaccharide deacetylase family protein [Bacteroidales bacterium]